MVILVLIIIGILLAPAIIYYGGALIIGILQHKLSRDEHKEAIEYETSLYDDVE
jgi:hypothetical protein